DDFGDRHDATYQAEQRGVDRRSVGLTRVDANHEVGAVGAGGPEGLAAVPAVERTQFCGEGRAVGHATILTDRLPAPVPGRPVRDLGRAVTMRTAARVSSEHAATLSGCPSTRSRGGVSSPLSSWCAAGRGLMPT